MISPFLFFKASLSGRISTHLKDSPTTIPNFHSVRWTINRDVDEGSSLNAFVVALEWHELLFYVRYIRCYCICDVQGQKQDECCRQYNPQESHLENDERLDFVSNVLLNLLKC